MDRARIKIFWIGVSIAPFFGLVSVCVPAVILDVRRYDAPLFPLIRSGIEGMSGLTFVLLFLSGLLLGNLFAGKSRKYSLQPTLLGLSTMALFPILAVAEMVVDAQSHNLWPIEFLQYGLFGVIPVAGSYIGWGASLFRRK